MGVFLATHLLTATVGGFFDALVARATDRLFALRGAFATLAPAYDPAVIHVVIDDASIRELDDFYIDRTEHARLVDNLRRAGVAVQFHDLIFAAPDEEEGDRALELATAEAGNVYYGLGIGLSSGTPEGAGPPDEADAIAPHTWPIDVGDGRGLPRAGWYFPTYPALAEAARGLGFLDVLPDRDGVYRRASLVARDREGGRVIPSVALRVVCDYLGVDPSEVEVRPGRSITLRGASHPASVISDTVRIPLDRKGRTVVNYIGPWGAMRSYPFSAIYQASDDRFMMEDLREELEGKIAIVSYVATGAEDIGPIPLDPLYPRPGIHATLINSILTEEFLYQLSGWEMVLWIELPILILLGIGALRFSAVPFVSGALVLGVAYVLAATAAFLWGNRIFDIPGPLILLVGSTLVIASFRYHVESKARARLDRELAMARDIQQRTFPSSMPELCGYDLAGRSEPADETGGDSYDAIRLDEHRVILLLGDATGHGLAPALSVTQVRSMLRVAVRLGADLDTILTQINDQLAEDLASNRFVTAFLGILDNRTHTVTYHAAGQAPVMHYHAATGKFDWHEASTIPMGMMEQLAPAKARTLELAPGDVLGLITDGLYEYENTTGAMYGEEPAAKLVEQNGDRSAEQLVEGLFSAVREFGAGVPQADDITMLIVRRLRSK